MIAATPGPCQRAACQASWVATAKVGTNQSIGESKIVINMATVAPGYSEMLAAAGAAGGGSYVEGHGDGSERLRECHDAG